MRRLLVIALMFWVETAWAAGPTVASVQGKVAIVKNGASREAKKGDAIAREDFLRIDEGASVTITLATGKPVEVKGKALLPGRRLHDAKIAGGLSQLAVALQTIAGKQDGGSAPASMSDLSGGSGPNKTMGESAAVAEDAPAPTPPPSAKRSWWPFGSRKKAPPDTTAAESDEGGKMGKKDTSSGGGFGARGVETRELESFQKKAADEKTVLHVAAQPAPMPQGPLDEARSLARADLVKDAIAKLDLIAKDAKTDPQTLASALVLRARLRLQSGGDDAAVRDDLRRVATLAPGSEAAHEAAFLLGALTLADGRRDAAKRQFEAIPAEHPLRAQATTLLDAK